jgi:hypothetical protein
VTIWISLICDEMRICDRLFLFFLLEIGRI